MSQPTSTHHGLAATTPAGRPLPFALTLALLVTLVAALPAFARTTVETATGLRVTIHEPADILADHVVVEDGQTWLRHPTAGEVPLDTVAHPWDTLHPLSGDVVAAALATTHGFATDVALDVFLLPGLPAGIMGSFARRDAIFLAPALAEPAPQTVAWLVTHELGHVLCWAAVDGRPERWAAYRQLRGLDPDAVDAELPHAERHREIIAEDLRHLFGGPLATATGTIENAALPLPEQVDGLRELLAGFLADPAGFGAPDPIGSRAFPNPCRVQTTVELTVGGADKAGAAAPVLEIYDVRGRLVRRIGEGRVTGGRAMVRWDGTDSSGRRAPDGVYLYRIRSGSIQSQGRVMLLRR